MHVRVTRRQRGTKAYRSVQLVQSYRRQDGVPAHKVLATFGNLSELETENLRRAISASRRGASVVLAPSISGKSRFPRVQRNLSYLDVAVCYRTWTDWKLSELIDELAPVGKREVPVGETVAALAVQRCVAPASKFEASRWYARTALPELQGIAPGQFNNTRIHRALEAFEKIEMPLQDSLARRVDMKEGRFACLFLDCTDTWFVGQGPELAHKRVTKEGLMRRQIGIALLCDPHGFPLRWSTIAGNHHEATTMTGIVDQVGQFGWAHGVPLVVDRAMGRGVTVEALLARDVQFITAVPSPEITSYSHRIPLGAFDNVDLGEDEIVAEHVLQQLGRIALDTGFEAIPKKRYVLDLGVFTKGEGDGPPVTASWLAPSRAKGSLQLARRLRLELDAGASYKELEHRYGYTRPHLHRCIALLSLEEDVQSRIDAGEADRLRVDVLRELAALPEHKQAAALDKALHQAADSPPLRATGKLAGALGVPPLQIRAVALFTPERFVEQRKAATRALSEVETIVEELNTRFRSPHNRRSRESMTGRLTGALKHRNMLDLFNIRVDHVDIDGRAVLQAQLARNDAAWQRRRCLDGITLIVAHPELQRSSQELVELYFAKDQVEKDFQNIKSVLSLRPVHHHTDPKVRAHVSLCMLALLVERTIEKRLREAGAPMTASTALHELKTGHLNLYEGERAPAYSATQPDPEQRRILTALGMKDLDDDDTLAEMLTPR